MASRNDVSRNKRHHDTEDLRERIMEVLYNVNWLLESHESYAELVSIEGNKVIIRCVGHCAECETNCVGQAFEERMPDIELILQ